jgi:hypothetical protein
VGFEIRQRHLQPEGARAVVVFDDQFAFITKQRPNPACFPIDNQAVGAAGQLMVR